MVHTMVDGTFRQTNLTNESAEYLAKREELRLAEIGLMHQRERVAELRRHLPRPWQLVCQPRLRHQCFRGLRFPVTPFDQASG